LTESSPLIPKEGEPLKYFENKERYLGYAKEGEKERVWYLCTPYFGDSGDGVWVVGMGGSLGIVEVQCPGHFVSAIHC